MRTALRIASRPTADGAGRATPRCSHLGRHLGLIGRDRGSGPRPEALAADEQADDERRHQHGREHVERQQDVRAPQETPAPSDATMNPSVPAAPNSPCAVDDRPGGVFAATTA